MPLSSSPFPGLDEDLDPRLAERIAALSPAKRRLLEAQLRRQGTKATARESPATDASKDYSLIPRRSTNAPAPLSFGQRRFWFLHELERDHPLFNNVHAAHIRGALDIEALERALTALTARHEILRTVYRPDEDGEPRQIVLEEWDFALHRVDLRPLLRQVDEATASDFRDTYLQELLVEEARRPFDLACDLPLRATVYILGEQEYVFCQVHHHIATDFWASGIIRRELVALYSAFRRADRPSPTAVLPELPLQYADYAIWQRAQEKSDAFRQQLDYWRRQLQPPLPILNLPTDAPRPAVQSYRGAVEKRLLPAEWVQQMQQLGRDENATLFMVLMAAFLTLFHRYSGQDDLVVGVLSAGRTRAELENLVGTFLNTLVFRLDASGEPTFRQFLARVRQITIEAFNHQDVPFERVVAELQPQRHLSAAPLVEIVFDFLNAPGFYPPLPDVEWTPLAVDKGTTEYDLLITARPEAEGLLLGIRYKTDLFKAATIQRMLAHVEHLLTAALRAPDTPITRLPLMSEAERRLVLEAWNDTALAVPEDVTFIQLFEQQARATPQAIAVADGSQSLSYAQLDARADRLARMLHARGVQPQHIVPLLAERNTDFLATMLAIWKLGAVYLPIDPRLPSARVRQILAQSRSEWLIVARSLADLATDALADPTPPLSVTCWLLEDLLTAADEATNRLSNSLPGTPAPDDLAYVIYTSGSTGTPKGAMIEHRGMLNHLFAKVHDLGLHAADVVAQASPQSFDISVWQFLAALLVGGQIRIFPDEVAFDPQALLQQLDEQRVTVFEGVPSLLRAMLDVDTSRPQLAALRWLIPTGEAMPPALARAWFQRFPHLKLMNAYGPTECSDDVTHHIMTAPPPPDMVNLPIGRPVANMRIYILDRHRQPVPVGVPGEIYVAGVGVGRGYLYDPIRTAEAFLPDPFQPGPDDKPARMYRTGDLGRWLADGTIEFLGRVDFQVKIRGHRIEPGEIEHVLLQHPAIAEAAVVTETEPESGSPAEAGTGSLRLVAYLALRQGHTLGVGEVIRYLRQHVPAYMIPSAFSILAAQTALPKTHSGKIDRRALSRLRSFPATQTEQGCAEDFVAPATPTEQAIAAIWATLLTAEEESEAATGSPPRLRIGRHDPFFELGGHSLLAAQLVYRLRREFNADLSLRQFFENPTVAGLAALLRPEETLTERERAEAGKAAPAPLSLLPLRASGTRPPLFFLAGGGGSEDEYLTVYAGLIHHLGPEQPIYGFQTRGLYGTAPLHRSVTEMAADFVGELRTLQPQGPYYLVGE
ncbi:MAG: amino acid adenylation domain-containing protein, partial [Gemmataceae bacterium]|nr:amino acid adenylation domain-containing protein [Gemmataceae bacterium]MDW8268265.1 amino acid adenylation domain-containing protein [Anaerolineae bacterium]